MGGIAVIEHGKPRPQEYFEAMYITGDKASNICEEINKREI